jgi:hypothetical protein
MVTGDPWFPLGRCAEDRLRFVMASVESPRQASATGNGGKPPHSTWALGSSGADILRAARNIRIAGQVNRKQACCKKERLWTFARGISGSG